MSADSAEHVAGSVPQAKGCEFDHKKSLRCLLLLGILGGLLQVANRGLVLKSSGE